jgi:hypothetical protein
MVHFLVANCSLIPKIYMFCCLKVNFKDCRAIGLYFIFLTTGGQIRSEYMKFLNFANFDQFQPLKVKGDLQTRKDVDFWNQLAIFNQKKYHINK